MQSPVVYITTLTVTKVMFSNQIMTLHKNITGLFSKQCKKVYVALYFAPTK